MSIVLRKLYFVQMVCLHWSTTERPRTLYENDLSQKADDLCA